MLDRLFLGGNIAAPASCGPRDRDLSFQFVPPKPFCMSPTGHPVSLAVVRAYCTFYILLFRESPFFTDERNRYNGNFFSYSNSICRYQLGRGVLQERLEFQKRCRRCGMLINLNHVDAALVSCRGCILKPNSSLFDYVVVDCHNNYAQIFILITFIRQIVRFAHDVHCCLISVMVPMFVVLSCTKSPIPASSAEYASS